MAYHALVGGGVGAIAGSFIGMPGLGFTLGSAVGGAAGAASSSRYATINPQRIAGNAFAQGCVRYGVGSAQCPTSELDRWAQITRSRYPAAYATVIQPLIARQAVPLTYLQQLARDYLQKRTSAPGVQEAARLLGVGGTAGGGYATGVSGYGRSWGRL